MTRRVRVVMIVGLLLMAAASIYRYVRDNAPDPAELRAAQLAEQIEASEIVSRGDIILEVSATGVISPAERLPLFFTIPGIVAEVAVAEGDRVQADQALARLDAESLGFALREAELALELQQVALDALTTDPRDADLAAAQAAVYSASTQLELAQQPPDADNERIALLQVELARNQLWQAQLQRDQARQAADAGFASSGQAAQAEAAVNRAQYEVNIAEQQLLQARGQTANAVNIASAQAALVGAQAALDRLLDGAGELDLAIADARLQSARLAVDLARYQLEQAELAAPFDGVITQQNLTVGEAPPTNRAAVVLVDDSSYYIDLAVDELDIARVVVGQRVDILLDALPGVAVGGAVTRTSDVATDLGGVITYQVRVTLEPAAVPIRTGMSATATIIVDEIRDVLRVRTRFISFDRRTQEGYVTVRRPDGRFEEVAVELGRRNDTYIEIVAGLQAGDEVVLVSGETFDPLGFVP